MQQEEKREWLRLFIKPVLLACLLISLLFLYRWYNSAEIGSILSLQLDPAWLTVAFVSQGIVTILFIAAWGMNIRIHFGKNLGAGNTIAMIGYNSIGKYTPGKVLGLVARGAALYNLTLNKSLVMQSTLLEQLALVHSGIILVVLAWALQQGSDLILGAAIVVCTCSTVAVALSHNLLLKALKTVFRKGAPQAQPDDRFRQCYLIVLPVLLLQWLVSAATLYAIIQAFELGVDFLLRDAVWITTLAYLTGFMAFFTLAGLGVREGVMTSLLASFAEVEIAVYVAIVHRLITLAFDVMLGLYAFFRTASLPPSNESS